MTNFVDSAFGPTPGQLATAIAQGVEAWAFYRAGTHSAAFHVWTDDEVGVLAAGGLRRALPIFVPDLGGPYVADARAFVASYQAAGWDGAGALDTEAYMRGNPRLAEYVEGFCAEMRALGQAPVNYAGGDYFTPNAATWSIWPAVAPPGQARQTGTAVIDGLTVDTDNAGDGFPFARPINEGDGMSNVWGADSWTDAQRTTDARRAYVRQWFIAYQGGEPSATAQATAVTYWAQHGGDLTLAAIRDGSIARAS